jgi:hypothetical protein
MKRLFVFVLSLLLLGAFTFAVGCKKAEEKKPAEAPATKAPAPEEKKAEEGKPAEAPAPEKPAEAPAPEKPAEAPAEK